MVGKIQRLISLFKIYKFHAFHLIINPFLGRDIWIMLDGRKIWLNFDSATYYHLIHSVKKVKKLVDAIPHGLSGAILDGGANHGIFSLLASQKFPESKVLALEPYQKVLQVLRKNVDGTNVSIIEKALAAHDGDIYFFTDPGSDQIGSTVRHSVEEFSAHDNSIVESYVSAISLKPLVKSEGIAHIAVLKLDVQGAEYSILENADEVLAITDCLLLEVVLIEQYALELLEKARKFFPYHKVLNPLPYGADIIFSKTPL